MVPPTCKLCGYVFCDCIDVDIKIINEKNMDEEINQYRFEMFYKRVQEIFELLYRFTFFCIIAFFLVNLILLLVCLTFIFVLLSVNHMIIPLARTAGLY